MDNRVLAALGVVISRRSTGDDVCRALGIIIDHPAIASVWSGVQEAISGRSPQRRKESSDVRGEALTQMFLLIRTRQHDGVLTLQRIKRLFAARMKHWARSSGPPTLNAAASAPARTYARLVARACKAGIEPTITALAEFVNKPAASLWSLRQAARLSKTVVHHCEYALRENGCTFGQANPQRSSPRSSQENTGINGIVEELCDQHDRLAE